MAKSHWKENVATEALHSKNTGANAKISQPTHHVLVTFPLQEVEKFRSLMHFL